LGDSQRQGDKEVSLLSAHEDVLVSRLPLISRDQAPLTVRRFYPAEGDASNITKTLAGAPDTLAVLAPLLSQVMNASTVDYATKEVVVLRVSAVNRCAYCVPTHALVARDAGLSAEAVVALASGDAPDDRLEPAHQALVRYCDQVVADASRVDDALLAEMREHFADHEIVELTVLTGAITTLNYVASVAGLPLDPRAAGAQ
jgi:AhpD family alkylhydroperoxidase